ncbi:carbohydrate kinase family protein [Caproicibacter sp.]|uniref:carbohydrate kinase family protein n=1 Tax=Caproicibacter sp. TaxID=2814884 RepID=UPI00398A4AEC
MFDVTSVGELLVDFTPAGFSPEGDLLFARKAGGAPANVLSANSKLGGKTAFIGKVGDDLFGRFLKQILKRQGIDTSGLAVDPEIPTTLAFVQLDPNGDRSFSFYRKPGADMLLRPGDFSENLIRESHIFHFGSVSLTEEPARSTTFGAVAVAKKAGCIISFDPNYRAPLWKSPDDATQQIKAGLRFADIVKVSEEEMTLITGRTEPEEGARILAKYGAALILVSLGPKGAFYYTRKHSGTIPTYDVRTVDTNGAGDAFFGAIHYCLRGKTLPQISNLSREELNSLISFGNAAGALTTTRPGSMPAMPTLAEIEICRSSYTFVKRKIEL